MFGSHLQGAHTSQTSTSSSISHTWTTDIRILMCRVCARCTCSHVVTTGKMWYSCTGSWNPDIFGLRNAEINYFNVKSVFLTLDTLKLGFNHTSGKYSAISPMFWWKPWRSWEKKTLYTYRRVEIFHHGTSHRWVSKWSRMKEECRKPQNGFLLEQYLSITNQINV